MAITLCIILLKSWVPEIHNTLFPPADGKQGQRPQFVGLLCIIQMQPLGGDPELWPWICHRPPVGRGFIQVGCRSCKPCPHRLNSPVNTAAAPHTEPSQHNRTSSNHSVTMPGFPRPTLVVPNPEPCVPDQDFSHTPVCQFLTYHLVILFLLPAPRRIACPCRRLLVPNPCRMCPSRLALRVKLCVCQGFSEPLNSLLCRIWVDAPVVRP